MWTGVSGINKSLIPLLFSSVTRRAEVAKHGQRRKIEGLVSQGFAGSNPVLRIKLKVWIIINIYSRHA